MNSGNDERLYLHHRLSAFHTGIPIIQMDFNMPDRYIRYIP